MQKNLNRATFAVAFLTVAVGLVGMLFTLFNGDYTAGHFGRGFGRAWDNYRHQDLSIPIATSLSADPRTGWSFTMTKDVHERNRLGAVQITSGGRHEQWEQLTLPPATMAIYVSGDAFPSVLFHCLGILAFVLMTQAVMFMARAYYKGWFNPSAWSVWRGQVN